MQMLRIPFQKNATPSKYQINLLSQQLTQTETRPSHKFKYIHTASVDPKSFLYREHNSVKYLYRESAMDMLDNNPKALP